MAATRCLASRHRLIPTSCSHQLSSLHLRRVACSKTRDNLRLFANFTSHPQTEENASPQTHELQERVVDISQLVTEAKGYAHDLVFTDDGDDEPIWEFESRFAVPVPIGPVEPAAEVKNALDPTLVDITSAYSVEQGFREVSADQLASALATNEIALVLDVRTQQEVSNEGWIAGSRHISMDRLSSAVNAGELDDLRTAALAVICASGSRSAQATVRLSKVFRFPNVTNVKGGMQAWKAMGYPVER